MLDKNKNEFSKNNTNKNYPVIHGNFDTNNTARRTTLTITTC